VCVGARVYKGPLPNEPLMTVVCPICKSSAQELLHTGDAAAFHCPTHGDFKVADTVFAKDYTREQWEAALDKAEQRAEPDEDEWPLIIVDDFYRSPIQAQRSLVAASSSSPACPHSLGATLAQSRILPKDFKQQPKPERDDSQD
jgi:hypothetical protein